MLYLISVAALALGLRLDRLAGQLNGLQNVQSLAPPLSVLLPRLLLVHQIEGVHRFVREDANPAVLVQGDPQTRRVSSPPGF